MRFAVEQSFFSSKLSMIAKRTFVCRVIQLWIFFIWTRLIEKSGRRSRKSTERCIAYSNNICSVNVRVEVSKCNLYNTQRSWCYTYIWFRVTSFYCNTAVDEANQRDFVNLFIPIQFFADTDIVKKLVNKNPKYLISNVCAVCGYRHFFIRGL